MNPRSTLRALRFRRKKKWSEFSTRNCGTTQISDSYALAPSITLNPGLEPDRLQQENASSSGMGLDGQFAQQRWRAGHIRFGSRLCEKSVVQFACRTFVSISSIPKTIALGTSVKSRQLRKQFCAPLARATFHTAWTQSGYVRLAIAAAQTGHRGPFHCCSHFPAVIGQVQGPDST